jgi:hypothetical protein
VPSGLSMDSTPQYSNKKKIKKRGLYVEWVSCIMDLVHTVTVRLDLKPG